MVHVEQLPYPGPPHRASHADSDTSGQGVGREWEVGEVVEDSNGVRWQCTVAGNPGTWEQLAAGDAPAVADLTDVSGVAEDGDVLAYDGDNELWRPTAPSVPSGASGPSSVRWQGPYTITHASSGLLTATGAAVFTPTPGDWLLGRYFRLTEKFVSTVVDESPRIAFGTWANSDENVLGYDSDEAGVISTHLWATGTDTAGYSQFSGTASDPVAPMMLANPIEFLTASPVRAIAIDGAQDPFDAAKPHPLLTGLSAGAASWFFLIATPTL